ncbi:MAG TPA: YkgJ family cysteine cluster protein [Ferruginibacter sp.]|nr:YkgJ family cysteine cluster protein [Ferruginibacter sp.]
MNTLETDRDIIARLAIEREDANDHFADFLRRYNSEMLDCMVHQINDEIAPRIDCTACGACCRSLMINVTTEEKIRMAAHLDIPEDTFANDFLEEGLAGNLIMNTIPCTFLSGNLCTVYEDRFSSCRDFPHLYQEGFQRRLFVTFMHYGRCPIVYNVIETLKMKTGFKA